MARTLDHTKDLQFDRHHSSQISHRAQKDIFFVWLLLVLIAVIGAHFFLNLSGGTPTGYVTANQDPSENFSLLIQSMFIVFIVVFVVALIYTGISKFDH